jgi:hypothetical protein
LVAAVCYRSNPTPPSWILVNLQIYRIAFAIRYFILKALQAIQFW